MDSQRLLAYGGNSYTERLRIGAWPPVEPGALGDRYGLDAITISYGVGLLGNRPTLILRQLQGIACRGGYPYTLLLDPGPDVWRRAGWNGAMLVAAILRDEGVRRTLLEQVETWSDSTLSTVFDSVAPGVESAEDHRRHGQQGGRSVSADLARAVRHFWLGALHHDAPVVAGSTVGTAVSSLDPSELAACVHALPPCFRSGRGWLVGSGPLQASAFGSHAVFDPVSPKTSVDATAVMTRGARLSAGWLALCRTTESRTIIATLAELPMCAWPQPVERVLDAIASGDPVALQRAVSRGPDNLPALALSGAGSMGA